MNLGQVIIKKQESISLKADEIMSIYCLSIAYKIKSRRDIDKIFNENRLDYINAYKKSILYKSSFFECETIDVVQYAEKLAGIVMYEYHNKNTCFKNSIFIGERAFKKVINNLKQKKEKNFEDIVKNTDNNWLGVLDTIAIMFLYSLKQDILTGDYKTKKYLMDAFEDFRATMSFKENLNTKENKEKYKEEIKLMKNELGLNNMTYTMEKLIEAITTKEIKKQEEIKRLNNNLLIKKTNEVNIEDYLSVTKEYDIEELLNLVRDNGLYTRYIGILDGLLSYFRVNSFSSFTKNKIKANEVEELLLNSILAKEHCGLSEEETRLYFMASIFLFDVAKQYNDLKNKYLKDFNEDYIKEVEELKQQAIATKNKAKNEIDIANNKVSNIEKEKGELLDENEQLKREINRLKSELSDYKDAKIENIKLRNYVFKKENKIDEYENEEIKITDEDINKLNNKNIVILGGSVMWMRKMKEVLPNVNISNLDSKHYALDFLNEDSIVFINTDMNHGFYYKVNYSPLINLRLMEVGASYH